MGGVGRGEACKALVLMSVGWYKEDVLQEKRLGCRGVVQ